MCVGRTPQDAPTNAAFTGRWRLVAVSLGAGTLDVHVDGELLITTPALTSRTDMLEPGDVISVQGGVYLFISMAKYTDYLWCSKHEQ